MDLPIERLVEAWGYLQDPPPLLNPPAGRSEIEGAGIGTEMAKLYRLHNGGEVLEGNVKLMPLTTADAIEYSVSTASQQLRDDGWPIPEELFVFGGNGQGELFGLWSSKDARSEAVIEVGQIFEPGCMAIVGTSFDRFLLARTAYYLLACEAPEPAFDMIGLPNELRSSDPEDETWEAIHAWADPELPDYRCSSYESRLDDEAIREWIQSR